jgi:FixJ family two-component response regulator
MATESRSTAIDLIDDVRQRPRHVPAREERSEAVSGEDSIVFVVDDDPSMREAVTSLLRTVSLRVQTFGTAREFLAAKRPDRPSCVVLDVRLPGLSGLDLQRAVASVVPPIQIVFITAHADIPMSVQAMKAGAVEFLTKPFRDQQLLDAVQQAIARDCAAREELAELTALRQRYESLSPREHEVMKLVVAGLLNKQIAAELGTSEATVKAHRAQLTHKMNAESLAHLVRMAERLDLLSPSVLAPRPKSNLA